MIELQAEPAPTPLRWGDLFRAGRARLTVGLILVEVLAAIQTSVVASIMPAVKQDLGGLEFYGLVFSGYVLAGLAATPLAGRSADRDGPGRPFAIMLAIFFAGSLLAGFATSMPMLALARLVQGFGAGAQYTIAYGAMAKGYPETGRAKMLTLLSAMWIAPGLVGPAFGALVAGSAGWRWAFLSILPLMAVAAVLVIPTFVRLGRGTGSANAPKLGLRWPIQLAIGTGILLSGLTARTWVAIPAVIGGLAIGAPAAARVLPEGTFRARPGLAATVAVGLLVNLGFFTGFYFLPLLVTDVGHHTLVEAGVAISVVNVTWTAGTWYQERIDRRVRRTTQARLGATLLGGGLLVAASPMVGAPLIVAYTAWALGGAGMGLIYNTLYLTAVSGVAAGTETSAVASLQVTNRLGIALGTGLGGGAIAVSSTLGLPLAYGLGLAFALATAAALGGALLAGRMDRPAAA